jgi:hypothetical protein
MNARNAHLHRGLEIAAILLLLFSAMLDPRLAFGFAAAMVVAVLVVEYAGIGRQ